VYLQINICIILWVFNLCVNKVLTRYAESQALEYPLSLIKPVRILLSLEKREQTHHAKLFFRAAIRAIIDVMLAAFFMFAMLSLHTFAFAQNALLKAEPPPPMPEVKLGLPPYQYLISSHSMPLFSSSNSYRSHAETLHWMLLTFIRGSDTISPAHITISSSIVFFIDFHLIGVVTFYLSVCFHQNHLDNIIDFLSL